MVDVFCAGSVRPLPGEDGQQSGNIVLRTQAVPIQPDEIFLFTERFRAKDDKTPLVVVPTSFHSVTEEEFRRRGINIVIYANQLMRSQVPAMQRTAQSILQHHRAMEADAALMPFQEIIRLIPAEV